MVSRNEDRQRIVYLEAQVAELKDLLKRRSLELRRIQRHLDSDGLRVVDRILAGLPPLPRRPHELEEWQETTQLESADVEDSLTDLWRSLTPLDEGESS